MNDQHDRLRGHRIRNTLKAIPSILYDLEPTPKRGNGAGTSEPKLPISETVLEATQVLRSVVVSWARITSGERHLPPLHADTIPTLVAYLTYHSEWLGRHLASDEAEDEIADAVANLERLTDQPSSTVFAGHRPTFGQADYAISANGNAADTSAATATPPPKRRGGTSGPSSTESTKR